MARYKVMVAYVDGDDIEYVNIYVSDKEQIKTNADIICSIEEVDDNES